ncbi:MAG: hypothetical protein KF847_10190 [Pirellulales bacterium]|nr:hypothetical protein [Pirellulales bacterium]
MNPPVPGYVGPWTDINFGDAEAAVMAGTLTYGGAGYLPGTGGKVGKAADATGINAANSGRVYRTLGAGIANNNSTSGTIYLSWLFQNGNENAADNATTYQTLALYSPGSDPSGDGANRVFDAGISDADFGGTNYSYRVNNTTVADLGVALDANVHLFVAKFQLSAAAASDSVTVWLDPTLGGVGDPAGGVTISNVDLQFNTLALSDFASNSVAWDEIRWGNSFASVTTESFLACDVNNDGLCNSVDFGIIRDHMFTAGTKAQGDVSGDGFIDLIDFRLFKDDPNRVVGGASMLTSAAVPEPTGLLCFGFLSLALLSRGRALLAPLA